MKYEAFDADSSKIVMSAQSRWKSERDLRAVYTLASAGVLLPGFGADFVTSGKAPLLEDVAEMPKLSLQMVVKKWFEEHTATICNSKGSHASRE